VAAAGGRGLQRDAPGARAAAAAGAGAAGAALGARAAPSTAPPPAAPPSSKPPSTRAIPPPQKVKLVDAGFIWTEPHSKRLKVKALIQAEVGSRGGPGPRRADPEGGATLRRPPSRGAPRLCFIGRCPAQPRAQARKTTPPPNPTPTPPTTPRTPRS
jgi:hypothetical protein